MMVLMYEATNSGFSDADESFQFAAYERSLLETLELLGSDLLSLHRNPASLSLSVKLSR